MNSQEASVATSGSHLPTVSQQRYSLNQLVGFLFISSVGIAMKAAIRFPAGTRDFSLLENMQSRSGAHLTL
jgi:hypothetical protein